MGWVVGERAAEASFGIGESNAREFGWEHRLRAALVRHCVLAGFSCLPVGSEWSFGKIYLKGIKVVNAPES